MSAHAYRRLLILIVVLGMLIGLWILPRGFSFGSTVSTRPIELQSVPEPRRLATPQPAAPPASVDGEDQNDDDGDDDRDGAAGRDDDDDARSSRRADLRGQRIDAPAADDDDDDDGDDGDDDDDDDDDEGDDD